MKLIMERWDRYLQEAELGKIGGVGQQTQQPAQTTQTNPAQSSAKQPEDFEKAITQFKNSLTAALPQLQKKAEAAIEKKMEQVDAAPEADGKRPLQESDVAHLGVLLAGFTVAIPGILAMASQVAERFGLGKVNTIEDMMQGKRDKSVVLKQMSEDAHHIFQVNPLIFRYQF